MLGDVRDQRLRAWMASYGDALLRTCYLWLKDLSLAEDAVQDTFLKAWKAMDSFEDRHEGSEKAWLMRIAANTCKDYRRGAWFKLIDRATALEDLAPALMQVEDEDRSLFLSVLAIPLKLRQVILLYYYQGLTLREVAQALNLNVSSVHSRLRKAQTLLKMQLEGEIGDEQQQY